MKQMRYSEEQKRWALEQMKVPVNKTVKQLAKETGITEVTLRTWRDEAARKGESIPSGRSSESWSSAQKFHAVLESAPLSEQECVAYCRGHGILLEQLNQWRLACEQANSLEQRPRDQGQVTSPQLHRYLSDLEKELRRKDAALAEAAALLVLRKKASAIWGTGKGE